MQHTIELLKSAGMALLLLMSTANAQTKNTMDTNHTALSTRHHNIILISAFTAKGDLVQLTKSLNKGLDEGLTVNEIKEVLVHLYAYCGFPRSLQGVNTFITVLGERKGKGITDKVGKTATPLKGNTSRYERGKKVLETLTGQVEKGPKTGYAAFSPEIEVFLKEHLFADLFTRDILSYSDREIATISALINLGGVEPMLQSHLKIAQNLGFTSWQLQHIFSIVDTNVGRQEADAGRKVLALVTNSSIQQNVSDTTNILYAKGVRASADLFTGTVWVNTLAKATEPFDCSMGVVTFEPGARSNWHMHPGGQILLVTDGKGYFQERGKAITIMQKGDVIKCLPGIEHWHGATPDTKVTHIAIATDADKGTAVWLLPVTNKEYNDNK